ncbi:MAG: hypothetical protein MZV70_19890 [Desulfobacterales bacterium]|nr:hypothetical protein [Desulfobacterales bacterium]
MESEAELPAEEADEPESAFRMSAGSRCVGRRGAGGARVVSGRPPGRRPHLRRLALAVGPSRARFSSRFSGWAA